MSQRPWPAGCRHAPSVPTPQRSTWPWDRTMARKLAWVPSARPFPAGSKDRSALSASSGFPRSRRISLVGKRQFDARAADLTGAPMNTDLQTNSANQSRIPTSPMRQDGGYYRRSPDGVQSRFGLGGSPVTHMHRPRPRCCRASRRRWPAGQAARQLQKESRASGERFRLPHRPARPSGRRSTA